MLLNRDRAREVMDRHGLDGLVAQLSINVCYLSDYRGSLNDPGFFDATYFAVLPRREDAPAALVLPSFEIRRLVSEGGTWMPGVYSYSSPLEGATRADGTPAGRIYGGCPVRPGAALLPLEQGGVAITQRLREQMSADAIWALALARALRAAGRGPRDSRAAGSAAATSGSAAGSRRAARRQAGCGAGPGMVVNVDMPFTEIGWGSVHIEDTVVITPGGCEPLTSLDLAMRVTR